MGKNHNVINAIPPILGMILFIASISFFVYTLGFLLIETIRAELQDKLGEVEASSPCNDNISLDVMVEKRVMSENESQTVTASVYNQNKDISCDIGVSLTAPGFNIGPDTLKHILTVPPGKDANFTWILEPQKLGSFVIEVEADGKTDYINIVVTNIFGLTIWQAQLVSYIGTLLGTFFGPVLSFTWWYAILRKHKKKNRSSRSPTPVQPTTQVPQGPIEKLLKDRGQNAT